MLYRFVCEFCSDECPNNKVGVEMFVIPDHDIPDAEVAVFASDIVTAVSAAPFTIDGEEVDVNTPEFVYMDGSRNHTCKCLSHHLCFLLYCVEEVKVEEVSELAGITRTNETVLCLCFFFFGCISFTWYLNDLRSSRRFAF